MLLKGLGTVVGDGGQRFSCDLRFGFISIYRIEEHGNVKDLNEIKLTVHQTILHSKRLNVTKHACNTNWSYSFAKTLKRHDNRCTKFRVTRIKITFFWSETKKKSAINQFTLRPKEPLHPILHP